MRRRTPLSAPSLAFHREGDPEAAEQLRKALAVPPIPEHVERDDRPLYESTLCTHLFHSFAGRTHPLLVRSLLAHHPPGTTVFDPFVGSGTVLVEATIGGLRGVGCDVNPLAVRLARFKATPLPPPMQRSLLQRANAIAELSFARVESRQRPSRVWDQSRHYPPHVFLELCGLREEIAIAQKADPPLGEALLLIFSSLILKASIQRAETRADSVERHIGRGQLTRWFFAKAEEVARLHAALFSCLDAPLPPLPLCFELDARKLAEQQAVPLWNGSIDVVITSPPYLGTYDYAHHHARRFAWLDIDAKVVERSEMAARRHGDRLPLPRLIEQHRFDTQKWLGAVARLLKPGGRLYVLVGDSVVAGQALQGAKPIRDAAEHSGLRFIARAAADRPHYMRDVDSLAPRQEHLLLFER